MNLYTKTFFFVGFTTNHLMTGLLGNSYFALVPQISLRFEGNKINCFSWDWSLIVLCSSKKYIGR